MTDEMDQATIWNGPAGNAWVDHQDLLDRLLQPFEDLLVEALREQGASNVLDIGCGTGSTTIAAARIAGRATGVDISAPMLELARSRAKGVPAHFVLADAQTHDFEPARFDWIQSRFGVMFFGDPVAAFANLRRAAAPGANLCCAAWRGAADNRFMTTAERAAAPLLTNIPPRVEGGPGQFAFGDADHVRRILESSGWQAIDVTPVDVECTMTTEELRTYVQRLGPVGRALAEVDEATRACVVEAVRAAFAPYVSDGMVRFNAACWRVSARA
jgi:ubiquinone/menaquinone biosynthesis C-methylase UbiE